MGLPWTTPRAACSRPTWFVPTVSTVSFHSKSMAWRALATLRPHTCQDEDELPTDAEGFAERAEEAQQLTRLHIGQQQQADARRYNTRHREVFYNPGDQVWVWTPVCRRGLREKLLSRYFGTYKVSGRVSDVNYKVVLDSTSQA
ncbi:uncharacterized protein LOC142786826 [Rhipicephalus microplus]|uniref:uncharacterized protein LOC142786826 n=1 Tax=Rhipicephalus microplus TaxID=6941 RepID=UPI003F6CA5EB